MKAAGALRGLRTASQNSPVGSWLSVLPAQAEQTRVYAAVPEYWGKDSPYHPGTDFLGTPPDHLERTKNRPVSPHVFEIDGKTFHYKMPINAIASITTRATGVALTGMLCAGGAVELLGDLPSVMSAVQSSALVYPARAVVAFPLIYHYLAGVRHIVWDHWKYGKQTDFDKDPLHPKNVDRSSEALLATSTIGTLALTFWP